MSGPAGEATSGGPASGPLPERAAAYFRGLQDRIVAGLERLDGGLFQEDLWERPGGGGGRSRVRTDGELFEKGGVNFSDVFGTFSPEMARSLPGQGTGFRATGVSLVLHPRNPHVPTVHANVRFIWREGANGAPGAGWFGGGTDLTPYYVVPGDATAFHRGLKAICERHDDALYPRFKAWCDRYFYLAHRKEPRGVGGLFFDYLGAGGEAAAGEAARPAPSAIESDPERVFAFVRDLGDHMLDEYHGIVERRRGEAWTEAHRDWQLLRRGRYVEFNLIYDRGTLFGLKTDGRIESILMSLPPEVRWRYAVTPAPGTPEAETLAAICAQRDWAG